MRKTGLEQPLADRMRPSSFDAFFGQTDIVGADKLLRKLIDNDELSSIILWGPPGVGKTTLAHIIAGHTQSRFESLSAVMSGKEELKKVIASLTPSPVRGGTEGGVVASDNTNTPTSILPLKRGGPLRQRTILFIDEIHRWNKAQQDALLPYVERGDIILIGATTENPSFEIIGALLSRSRVFILKSLTEQDLVSIIDRALSDKDNGLGNYKIEMQAETKQLLAGLAGSDARTALNGLELAVKSKVGKSTKSVRSKIEITNDDVKEALQRTHLIFDKKGEEFYNLISALHKSMRGSDPNAALYWLARMLEGGADPLYVARRVLRFASEDIGMANSEALIQANAAYDACHKIGMPECTVHLAQAVVYCAKSAKSNVLYTAYQKAAADARNTSHLGVPIHLRNAPTKFMKEIGYGKDYKYNPDFEGPVDQEYLPKELKGRNYLKKE